MNLKNFKWGFPLKDIYRDETSLDVYFDESIHQPIPSYTDEYVRWLEAKLLSLLSERTNNDNN
jgi:hypothetical protein